MRAIKRVLLVIATAGGALVVAVSLYDKSQGVQGTPIDIAWFALSTASGALAKLAVAAFFTVATVILISAFAAGRIGRPYRAQRSSPYEAPPEPASQSGAAARRPRSLRAS